VSRVSHRAAADPLMRDAQRLHQAGRLAEAADLYRQVLREDPRRYEALYLLGMAFAQRGHLDQALETIGEALAVEPSFAEGWRARGLVLMHLGRREEARSSFDKALVIRPDFKAARTARDTLLAELDQTADALAKIDRALAAAPESAADWNSRGGLLIGLGRREEALASFDRALSLKPDFVEALSNRATVLFELDRFDEALAVFDGLLAVEPTLAVGWNNRGNTLMRLGRFEEAAQSYDRALALSPRFAAAAENREFALFQLRRTTRSPAKYVRGLFDEFSTHYDETMLNKLDYRAHREVRALADRVLPNASRPWRILDLGCGTGLLGTVFQGLAVGGCLDGIDISPRMIQEARKRGIYDDLIVGDLENGLKDCRHSYDLVIAADTMNYFGDLSAAFAGVNRRLEEGGFLLFTSETKDGDGWEETEVHRFRHSEAYLRAEAAAAGFECVEVGKCILRLEQNAPVAGFAVALKKPVSP
jgi:predicted TPR repeat methyltransferase